MSPHDFEVLYEAYIRYVADAYREHERLGTRQSDFELRTGEARTRQQFRAALEQLESDRVAKARCMARIQRGFHAEGDILRERFQAAIGRPRKKRRAA